MQNCLCFISGTFQVVAHLPLNTLVDTNLFLFFHENTGYVETSGQPFLFLFLFSYVNSVTCILNNII